MLRIAIGILALLFTLSEGRFFGSHAKNNLQSQDASDIAPVAEFAQHEYKGYIYHEGDEYHDNKDGAISGAQMIIRKKIAASLRTHFGKLQSVLTAFADDDGFVREGIVFCGAGRDEKNNLLEEPTMPANFHEEGARLIEYDGWGVIDDADAADKYNKDQCGKNNCNEGSAVASIANEIRASGYQIHHKDICEAKAASVSLSSRSANMKPYAESKAIVCANPYWYERLQDCIGIATDDAGDGEINCGSKCTIRKNHSGTDADGNTIAIDDAEYEDKMCWVDFDAILDTAGCARPLDDGASDEVNAKSPENIGAEDSINGIRRAMRYSLNAEVSVQTTDYAYFTGCQTDACLSLRQLFAALNGNAQISAFRDLGMEEAAAYWRDQIASIKTYLQSLADTFTDFREVSLDIFPYIENEEIVGCPMGEIEHAMGETGTDTQPLCYEIANTKRKLNEQSRDGQFISRGECACRNGLLSNATSELPITSAVEADYIYLYYNMPEGTNCDVYPTSVSTYCKQTDWHGGDWEETLLALIPNATTTRTKIYPTHSVHGIATTHAEREAEIAERRQAIQDALVGTFPETLDTSCGRIINADSGVRSTASPLLVSNKGGNCFPFPKMHEIIYRLEFETSEQGTGTYINALENGTASGDRVDQRFCAEKVADTELSFRQLAYRFKNFDDGGNQLKNEDTFSGNPAFDTHLDYLVYTNEKTYNNGTDEGVLVDRTFCVVNWLKEFGVRTLEDSTGEEFQDPFGLFEKEIAEAVFNTELAQSTKSKVVTDNILIWKAIRKELTTASDDNILDDIAKRAADHYLYVVSTDEDLIEPSTFRDAELVAEEVANFTVQTAELAIEITSEANNMQQTVVEVLQTADETEAETKANDLVQTLLDYVASMTNAGDLSGNAPARRRLHSSRKLTSDLSEPTLGSDTGKCNDCFGAANMSTANELSTAADWTAGIVAMANLKDAVKSNTDQCSTDHGTLGNFACDANNANNYENRVQDDKATYAAGNLPADVVVTFPTRTNFTDNIVQYIVDETVNALNVWKTDISTSREDIKKYVNNRAHAHHENETKTKTDIQAEISKLFDDGLDIQNKLKQSFKILKEYQQNYDSNEDFWGDDTLVQWPDTSTYLTETGQTATLATKQTGGEDVSLPVISQDFSLAHFPTADELQVQCQAKIAKLYYGNDTTPYTDFEEEHAAMATNAESGTGDLTLQELFETQRDDFQDVIDACKDTTIAAQYGVDDAHEVNGQKRTQTYIDTIDAACKDQFPFGSAIDCYRQRVESREQHLHNDAFMKSLELVQKGALASIKSRTETISTRTAEAGNSYITTRNQVAVNIVAKFRTLSAFADGTNDGGLTISEVAAKNADLVWSSASSADKFAYKLSTAAANSRTACIAIRAQAALIIKSAGEALSSAVTICDDTCTVSGVENFITSRKEHEDLGSVDNDRNFVNLAAFQKIETDLKAITVNADCYVARRVEIETMLAATGDTAGGVKDISIQEAGVERGNPTYKVNCYEGYTLTNDGKCELDDCTGNQYTVLASDEYDPHNSNLANVNVAASAAAGGKAVCKNCPAGKHGSDSSRLCVACPANSYNPNSNGEDCVAIPAGSVGTPLNGQDNGFTGVGACDPGQYQTTDGPDNMPVCRSCDSDSYSTNYGSTACIPVSTGHARAPDGKSQDICVAGFSSLGGSHPCASCPQGKISSQDGAHECTQCNAGKYASGFAYGAEPNRGATKCTSVPKGYSSNVAASERYEQNDGGHMTKCSQAQYSMQEGETECATCPAGKIVASDTIDGDTVQTSCAECNGEENIQCLDGINKVDCGSTDPNHADANNRNTHSVSGEWNDDGNAATACAPKSCSCSTNSFTGLEVKQYVADNNGGWETQAITALGNVALGDVCRLGNGVALGGGDGDNNAGANKAQVVGCSECAPGYGYDVLRDSSGNAVEGTKADGTSTYDVHICQQCPQGANTAGSGYHKTQCTSEKCPEGQGYPQTVFANADVDVPYSYKYSDAQASVCQFCNAGEYSDTNSFSDCLTIPSGFQCTRVHNAAGEIDSATYEQLSVPTKSDYGCSQIDLCPAGTFRHNHDAPSKRSRFGRCNPIPAGSYCSKFFAGKAGNVATGVTTGCGEISACPAGEYSAGNGAACVAIPAGQRCKSALKIVEGCDTADYGRDALNCNAFEDPSDDTQKIFKIYSHGDAVNVAEGFVNGTGGHLSSTFDLSTTTEPDIGCRDVEDCPAGEYYKLGNGFGSDTKMTCKSIPAGTRCSYNNVNTPTTGGGVATGGYNIDESSTGCEDVEDCAALHFTDSRKNICNKFTVCGEGKRVKTLGVRGTQATGAGSNSECSQCKLPDGNKANYVAAANTDDDVGWNGDEDDGSAFGNGCQAWTPCVPGEYLPVAEFGTITADKGACQACSDGTLNKRFYMPSDYLSNGISQEDSNGGGQTGEYTCTPGPTCSEENKGQLPCGPAACGCQTCGAGQSGAYGGECSTCGKGTKDDGTAGSGECANCQGNEYQNEEGQTTCKSIGAGDQCKDNNNLKTACEDIEECLAGSYATDTMHKCVLILPGHDCATIKTNNANPAEDSKGCEAQEKCAEGQYSTGGQNNCASIPVGHKCSTYYDDDGNPDTSDGVTTGCGAIEACADNEFSALGSATCTTITNCGVGHYIQTAAGSQGVASVTRYSSQRVCQDCPSGRFRSAAPETAASTAAEVVNTVCRECSDCAEGYVFVAHTPGSATCDGKGTACNKGCVDGNEVIDGTDKTCIPFACVTNCKPGMDTQGNNEPDATKNAATCQADGGRFDCGSCRDGYHVDTGVNPHTCVANQCGCKFGTGKLTDHTAGDATVVTCAVDLSDKAAEYNHTTHQDCASCPSSDRVLVTVGGRASCDTIVCTCANGTPKEDSDCGVAALSNGGNAKCSACVGGTKNAFVLNDDKTACAACEDYEYRIEGGDDHMTACADKVFVCDDGTATTASDAASDAVNDIANLDHGATHCSSCNANYELNTNNECVACAPGQYRTQAMTECVKKVFVCKDADGNDVGMAYDVDDVSETQKASLANGATHCDMCFWVDHTNTAVSSSGYFLNIKNGGNTCDACATGTKAKGTGLTDPDDGKQYTNEDSCEVITCECDNGTPADGEDTDFSGCGNGAKCSECDAGYVLSTTDDVTNNGATHVDQCIKLCACTGGTGARGNKCFAAGQGDCTECNSGFGYYLDGTVGVCLKCDEGAFGIGNFANAAGGLGACALKDCDEGKGFGNINLGDPMTSDQWTYYHNIWTATGDNAFRGGDSALTLTCSACPVGQFSGSDTISQCEPVPANKKCSEWIDDGSAGLAGCKATVACNIGNADTYTVTADVCAVASCDNGYTLDGGTCKADCSGTLSTDSSALEFDNNCCTDTDVDCAHHTVCTASCADSTKVADISANGYQNQATCSDGTLTDDIDVSCKLKDGEDCDDETECLNGQCWDYSFSGVSANKCTYIAPPTCSSLASCDSGNNLKLNYHNIKCLTGTCTSSVCCKANPTCDDTNGSGTAFAASSCDAGYTLKSELSVTCADATCASSDCCNADCTGNIAAGGAGNDAYTTDCTASDVDSGADCTLTCTASGYSGTSAVLCTDGTFATTVAPTCTPDPCTAKIANGGSGNDAYTSSCSDSDVNSGADCTLSCAADGYSGTSTVRCTTGNFATTVAPTCTANPTCDDIDGSGNDFASCASGYQLKSVLTGTCAGATCTASDCCNAITCDGTGISYTNADRNGDGGSGDATDPATTAEAYGKTIRLTCDKGRTCSGPHEFAVYTCGQDGTFTATTDWNHAYADGTAIATDHADYKCPTAMPTDCETTDPPGM